MHSWGQDKVRDLRTKACGPSPLAAADGKIKDLELPSRSVLSSSSILIARLFGNSSWVSFTKSCGQNLFFLSHFLIFLQLRSPSFLVSSKLLNFCSKTTFRWVETFLFLERDKKKKKEKSLEQPKITLPLSFNNIHTHSPTPLLNKEVFVFCS